MEVRDAIAFALMAVGGVACSSTDGCNSDRIPVEHHEIIRAYSGEECESLCTDRVEEDPPRRVREVVSCTLEDVDESGGNAGAAGASSAVELNCEAIIGTVCKGRRPLGYEERDLPTRPSLGEACAAFAELEAASVIAFEQLGTFLARFGAPEELIRRCRLAADDERRHARLFAEMAVENGHRMNEPRILDDTPANLEKVARHNAVEGCVAECWAALLAHLVAERAQTSQLRRAYRQVAEDETRHGQLAWDLHAWFAAKLDPLARRRVELAQRDALALLGQGASGQLRMLPPELGLRSASEIDIAAHVISQRLVS